MSKAPMAKKLKTEERLHPFPEVCLELVQHDDEGNEVDRPPRPDRPQCIPLLRSKTTRIGRMNQASLDFTVPNPNVAMVCLNDDQYTQNRHLLSRTHAEFFFTSNGKLYLQDGGTFVFGDHGLKESVNGTSVQGLLVPLGGVKEVCEGYVIVFGVPRLVPGRREDTPDYDEFVYRVKHHSFNDAGGPKLPPVVEEEDEKEEEKPSMRRKGLFKRLEAMGKAELKPEAGPSSSA